MSTAKIDYKGVTCDFNEATDAWIAESIDGGRHHKSLSALKAKIDEHLRAERTIAGVPAIAVSGHEHYNGVVMTSFNERKGPWSHEIETFCWTTRTDTKERREVAIGSLLLPTEKNRDIIAKVVRLRQQIVDIENEIATVKGGFECYTKEALLELASQNQKVKTKKKT